MVRVIVENNDKQYINAALAGDEDSYAALLYRYSPSIQQQMRHFSRDPLVIEELTQDVFVEAFLGLRNYRHDAPFVHWLASIASRTGYKYWKKKARQKKEVQLNDYELIAKDDKDRIDPTVAADLLFKLLAELGNDDRLVLTLMYFEECSTQEIAKRMGWSRVLVSVRAHRAKTKLKKLLDNKLWKEKLTCLMS